MPPIPTPNCQSMAAGTQSIRTWYATKSLQVASWMTENHDFWSLKTLNKSSNAEPPESANEIFLDFKTYNNSELENMFNSNFSKSKNVLKHDPKSLFVKYTPIVEIRDELPELK